MNDNDVVSREAVYRLADDLWHLMFNLEEDGDCIDMDEVAEKIHELAKLSPVEQPMSAVEYLRASDRMHNSVCSCAECPLSHYNNGTGYVCHDFVGTHPAEAVIIVEKWSREHPEVVNDAD